MELLSVIRRWHHREHMPIREIERRTGLSRNTIRKYLRSNTVEVRFKVPERSSRLDPYADKLAEWLRVEAGKGRKACRNARRLHADLVVLGYDGSYARVAAFIRHWRAGREIAQRTTRRGVFVPLAFQPGEAFQFDWSEDWAEIGGKRVKLQAAHTKLAHSRAFVVRAYRLQTHEMLFVSMPTESSPNAPIENSPLRYGSVASVATWWLDVGEVGEIEVDDGLERLGRGGLAQRVWQPIGPGSVFGLQGEQLGDGVVPALRPAAAVGRPAIADSSSRLLGLAGAVAGLAFGIGERLATLCQQIFRHGRFRYVTLDRRSSGPAQPACIVPAATLGGRPRRFGWTSWRRPGGGTGGSRSACWRMR